MAVDRGDMSSPFPEGACIFGSDEFVERIRGADPEVQSGERLHGLIAEACDRFDVEPAQLTSPVRHHHLTKVRAWIAYQAGVRGIAGRSEVARALGRSEGTLRSAILRYPNELE